MDFKKLDPELWQAIANEEQRQQNNIELIASENIVSKNVLDAQGSVLTNMLKVILDAVIMADASLLML